MTAETAAKFEAGRYENRPSDINWANLVFDLDKDGNGYVHNGAWYFKTIEFRPPYMRIEVLHPRDNFEVEYFHVVKI